MKKLKTVFILVLMTMLLLTACGKETFTCAVCMRRVNQVPHKATVFGSSVVVCDSCHKTFR